ncbi:MAG: DUF2061 domain-containing protein [Serpentinimonas sp.]|jgi:uncharacterized membrane protein|nr:DUF2061 domain-containing protein [Serpentinimonas sp.]
MAHIRRIAQHHRHTLLKTASYYLMHMVVAAGVAYAVTGSFWTALTLSLLEPTVQAVAFFFHEKAWARRDHRAVQALADYAAARAG